MENESAKERARERKLDEREREKVYIRFGKESLIYLRKIPHKSRLFGNP